MTAAVMSAAGAIASLAPLPGWNCKRALNWICRDRLRRRDRGIHADYLCEYATARARYRA